MKLYERSVDVCVCRVFIYLCMRIYRNDDGRKVVLFLANNCSILLLFTCKRSVSVHLRYWYYRIIIGFMLLFPSSLARCTQPYSSVMYSTCVSITIQFVDKCGSFSFNIYEFTLYKYNVYLYCLLLFKHSICATMELLIFICVVDVEMIDYLLRYLLS